MYCYYTCTLVDKWVEFVTYGGGTMKKVEFEKWQFKPNKTKDITRYKNRTTATYNYKLYIQWAISILQQVIGELPEGMNYYIPALRMHPDNNDYLRGYLLSGDWLCYSPVDDENVPLDEVWIDEEKAVVCRSTW